MRAGTLGLRCCARKQQPFGIGREVVDCAADGEASCGGQTQWDRISTLHAAGAAALPRRGERCGGVGSEASWLRRKSRGRCERTVSCDRLIRLSGPEFYKKNLHLLSITFLCYCSTPSHQGSPTRHVFEQMPIPHVHRALAHAAALDPTRPLVWLFCRAATDAEKL